MASIVRTLPAAAKRSFTSSAMASLIAGQQLIGAKYDYLLRKRLGEGGKLKSIVFEAQVLPKAGVTNPPPWVVVKTASPDNPASRSNLKRECDAYSRKSVKSNPCFREMYDTIKEPTYCLVLMGKDRPLDEVPYEPSARCYNIIADIVRKAVAACTALHADKPKAVDTDWKSDKIMLSNPDSDHPTAQIGDLGLVREDGELFECQAVAMRAPEIWEGLAFTYASQTWAIGTMLLCWIKPGILGDHDCNNFWDKESWAIAKLRRLFREWSPPPGESFQKDKQQRQFMRAEEILEDSMASDWYPAITNIKPVKEELHSLGVCPELAHLLQFMLVPDIKKRPSPEEVLKSDEWAAFKRIVEAVN